MPTDEWKLAALRKFRDVLNSQAVDAGVDPVKGQSKVKVAALYDLLLEKYETSDEGVAAKLQAARHEWETTTKPIRVCSLRMSPARVLVNFYIFVVRSMGGLLFCKKLYSFFRLVLCRCALDSCREVGSPSRAARRRVF